MQQNSKRIFYRKVTSHFSNEQLRRRIQLAESLIMHLASLDRLLVPPLVPTLHRVLISEMDY